MNIASSRTSLDFHNDHRERQIIIRYLKRQPFPLAMLRPPEAGFYPRKLRSPSLDLGCGDGFFAQVVFGKDGVDVGVDIDEKILGKAKASGVYKETFHFNGKKLPFDSRFFSNVIANCVLEHVDDSDPLLSEIARVTKPGGYFYFTAPTIHFGKMLLGTKILDRLRLKPLSQLYQRFMSWVTRQKFYWSKKKWINELKKVGFTVEQHEEFFGSKTTACFDLTHWLSIPSILTKLIFGRWILLNQSTVKQQILYRLREWCLKNEDSNAQGAFQFFAVRRNSL